MSGLAHRGVLFGEVVLDGLELLISIQVALEVLKEYHLLINRLWVVKEVE